MTEETVRQGVDPDPSLDADPTDDAQKGAAIGGIGGAVTGAVAGSMAGPIGTLAGAVIGGIVGAVTSKAAVGAIDRMEHENAAIAHDADHTAHSMGVEAPPAATVEPVTNDSVIQIPLPDGIPPLVEVTDDTRTLETPTGKTA